MTKILLRAALLLALFGTAAAAQTPASTTTISKLPIAVAVNPQTDYAVGIVRQVVNGVPAFGTYRVPLSVLVGPAGPANTLGIGSITTLPAGSSATASFFGQSPNQLLSLSLPAGATGPQGQIGQTGASGTPASFASVSANTLAAGSQATATLGGTGPSAYTITFGLPQGTPGTGNGNVNTTGTPAAGQIAYYPGTSGNTISPLVSALGVGLGGTGGTTAATARSGLGAAASGFNADITALTGLTTALPLTEGGTGGTTAATARSGLGAAASGANGDVTSLSGLTTPLSVLQGGTGATSATAARTALGAAGSGANTDITSLASPALGAATATTATAGTNTTQVATTAFVLANGGSGGGGFPSAFSTKSANYTVLTTDKNTLFSLSGSFTLSLPSAASFGAGNGIYLSKTDGNGVWAVTPASGTVDGLASINVYQERFALVSDGTNWRSVNRPKAWINIGTTTVSSAVSSLNITTGFADPELRDMQFDIQNGALSTADYINVRLQKSGTYQTSGYAQELATFTTSGVTGTATGGTSIPMTNVTASTGIFDDLTIYSFANGVQRYDSNGVVPAQSSFSSTKGAHTGVSAPVTGVQFYSLGGFNLTGGTFNQRAFRP